MADEENGIKFVNILSWRLADIDSNKANGLRCWKDGFECGYNKANEWHYVKDGDLPKQDGHTCFSIKVLAANNKKWVYYRFDSAKWFCGSKEVKVTAWKEIVFPQFSKGDK